jgi:hypothetical protein
MIQTNFFFERRTAFFYRINILRAWIHGGNRFCIFIPYTHRTVYLATENVLD